jgi:subtilase family serine protease
MRSPLNAIGRRYRSRSQHVRIISARFALTSIGAMAAGLTTAILVVGTGTAAAGVSSLASRILQLPSITASSTHLPSRASAFFQRPSTKAAPAGRVRIGTAPLLPLHARALAAVPAGTAVEVVVALQPRNPVALSNFATKVSTPGTAVYRHYLSVHQFAARYGATPATIAAVRSALTKAGLRLGATKANGLSFAASGDAAQIGRAFSTRLERYLLPSGRIAFANTSAPALPAGLARNVEAVIGLSDLYLAHPLSLLHLPARHVSLNATHVVRHASQPPAGAAAPCTDATSAATGDTDSPAPGTPLNTAPLASAAYTTDQFADAYDYDPLYQAGDFGKGATVGIFELEGNFPSDITSYEQCYKLDTSVAYVPEDGGPAAPNSSDEDGMETELDIENVIGLAPQSSVIVYQAPNSDTGLYDNYAAMVTNPQINVISTSWGECELEEGSTDANSENTLFQEAAAQGQSVVAAAGDSGAEDCAVSDAPLPIAAVDDPGSQPFVTSAGGTSLESIGNPPATPPTETVWNNGAALGASAQGGAGGGGVSELWAMPTYQTDAPTWLNTINSQSSGSTCSATTGDCREVPDVTASADLYNAYLVYYDGAWTPVGGTSGAAPLWASLFALADADAQCTTDPVGFANPVLYGAAGASKAGYADDFNDITTGNNDLFDTNGGQFAAGTAYDMASGLGSPIAGNLAPALCTEATAIATPTSPGAPASTTTTASTTTAADTTTDQTTTETTTDQTTTETTTETDTTTVTTASPATVVTAPGQKTTVTTPGSTRTVTTPGATRTVTVSTRTATRKRAKHRATHRRRASRHGRRRSRSRR